MYSSSAHRLYTAVRNGASTAREMRPTRRGYGFVAVAVFAFALGLLGEARSLNAVVVPALVGLTASVVQLARADAPTVNRSSPDPGFPGDRRRVTIDVDSKIPCTVTDPVEDSLSIPGPPDDVVTAAVGHGGRLEYDVILEDRGAHRLGPARCRLTDSLGLFALGVETSSTATAFVYPDVYEISDEELWQLEHHLGNSRSSFDRLREFTPGDTMRDVHWRASAKRSDEEFVVAEYRNRRETAHVEVVGESTTGGADAMASTLASVVAALHDIDATVTVTVPEDECVAHPGEIESSLRLLALTEGGRIDRETVAAADVAVFGEGDRTTVSVADRDIEFDAIVGSHRGQEVIA